MISRATWDGRARARARAREGIELLFLFISRLSPRLSQASQLFHRPNTRSSFTYVGHETRVSTPPGNYSVPTKLSTLHTGHAGAVATDYVHVVGFFR